MLFILKPFVVDPIFTQSLCGKRKTLQTLCPRGFLNYGMDGIGQPILVFTL